MDMNLPAQFVVFGVSEHRYALPLALVGRIIRAVEVTPLPGAPPLVLGVIDEGGLVVPVFNLRRRFRLPEREIDPNDQFLIASTSRRRVALAIDGAWGIVDYQEAEITEADLILPGLELIQGVISLKDGLVLIHDLEKFLSLEEALALDIAVDRSAQ